MQRACFVHLHVHSEYSLLAALPSVKELVQRAAELDMPALALTDFGNLFGAVEFYDLAVQHGIKPILGCEFFVCEDHTKREPTRGRAPSYPRLILLARTNEGWQNLMRLSTLGYLQGFYFKPRIDRAQIAQHAKGLIAIASGWHGEPQRLLREGRYAEAEEAVRWGLRTFGERGFFLGIQRMRPQNDAELVAFAHSTGVPIVATNEVFMLAREDIEALETLHAVQLGSRAADEFAQVTQDAYFRSAEEMEQAFEDLPEAIENAITISRRCNVELTLGKPMLPDFTPPQGKGLAEYLQELAHEGLQARWPQIKRLSPTARREEYEARLAHELAIITKMGFAGYFLIVADFIRWAKSQGIPVGPGRGSGAGSLVAYCLGITDLDPIRWGLLFERFLNPERVSMPDFDVDFCMQRRDEVLEYVARRYGHDHVAQIITFNAMKAKAAVRDVARTLGFTPEEADRVAKLIPNELGMTIARALEEEPRLAELAAKDERVRKLLTLAQRLEGKKRNPGKHAAGVVISRRPLVEVAPLFRAPEDDDVVVQWDMKQAEKAGLVKFDFLGLKTLTVLALAARLVREREDPDFSLEQIPLDDPKTFALYRRGETHAVFQVESQGMRELLMRMKPDSLEDLIAAVALYRPGPLESGMTESFVRRKHGEEEVRYPHPRLEPILKETYGVIVYQEQVMQIAQELAGYSLGQADLLRRAMGKKIPEEMERQRAVFVEGAKARGVDEALAARIFDDIAKFAGYGFNKSHSAAYALVSYQTAYMKAHYPRAFMAAVMSCDLGSPEKIAQHVQECARLGIPVLPPDVNRSETGFVPEGEGIRYGLGAIKGVGEAVAHAIVRERKAHGPFRGIVDFSARLSKAGVNRRVLEALVKAGAFGKLVPNPAAVLAHLDEVLEQAALRQKLRGASQASLFGGASSSEAEPSFEGSAWSAAERLAAEREALGFHLTGHPFVSATVGLQGLVDASLAAALERAHDTTLLVAGWVAEVRRRPSSQGPMAYVELEDGTARATLVCFARTWSACADWLEEGALVVSKVRVDRSRQMPQLLAEEVRALDEEVHARLACVRLVLDAEEVDDYVLTRLAELCRTDGTADLELQLRLASGAVARLVRTKAMRWSSKLHAELAARFGDKVAFLCRPVRMQAALASSVA